MWIQTSPLLFHIQMLWVCGVHTMCKRKGVGSAVEWAEGRGFEFESEEGWKGGGFGGWMGWMWVWWLGVKHFVIVNVCHINPSLNGQPQCSVFQSHCVVATSISVLVLLCCPTFCHLSNPLLIDNRLWGRCDCRAVISPMSDSTLRCVSCHTMRLSYFWTLDETVCLQEMLVVFVERMNSQKVRLLVRKSPTVVSQIYTQSARDPLWFFRRTCTCLFAVHGFPLFLEFETTKKWDFIWKPKWSVSIHLQRQLRGEEDFLDTVCPKQL